MDAQMTHLLKFHFAQYMGNLRKNPLMVTHIPTPTAHSTKLTIEILGHIYSLYATVIS
jgi:hypothetical protein